MEDNDLISPRSREDSIISSDSAWSSSHQVTEELKANEEKRLKKSAARACPLFVSIIIFIAQVGIFVGFAIFAYGSNIIDSTECYASPYSDVPVAHSDNTLNAVDVTTRFQVVIRFGFWISVLEILRQIIAQVAYQKRNHKMLYGAFVLQSVNCTFLIIDFVFMQLWRLSKTGRVCSGDYLVGDVDPSENAQYVLHEGLFLKVIIITAYSIIFLALLSVFFVAICLSRKKTEQEIREQKTAGQLPLRGLDDM